jgi:hypothetical protein
MKENIGTVDRILRVVLGLALLAGYYFNNDGAYSWLYLLGVIPLVTGLVKTCPIYLMLGISTLPAKK